MREIEEFVVQLKSRHHIEFLHDIEELKDQAKRYSRSDYIDYPKSIQMFEHSETAEKIERLLVHDTGMSKSHAVDFLRMELMQRYPEAEIPTESRKGFVAWIARLTNIIPEKELLHIATSLRNSLVHDPSPDWRLK